MRENKEETPLFPIRQELDEFSDYLQRKLVEDNEKEMEMRYWEMVEHLALMTK